ncbi:hypothetical protein Tco_0366667 [Tanacetum coccineum]
MVSACNSGGLVSLCNDGSQIAEEKVFANLLCDQCDDVRSRLAKLHVMIWEMEYLEDRLVVFDSLECLRETQGRKNNKLSALTERLVQTNDGIREKEGHVDIMDLSD